MAWVVDKESIIIQPYVSHNAAGVLAIDGYRIEAQLIQNEGEHRRTRRFYSGAQNEKAIGEVLKTLLTFAE